MNILIPDSWLREHLKTKATPKQLKGYLSLCGPSVERIATIGKEPVYEIEITSNRPDSMSVVGIAREAAAIVPRFGITAKLINDPYTVDTATEAKKYKKDGPKKLSIIADPRLCLRWASIVIEGITVGPSPAWLTKKLELTGIRPINTIVDITNYLMRLYGQPAHAFDYDEIKPKNGVPTMILRASKKGEKLTTLDDKTHTLAGGDIVIEDGSGRLIDLCGIMGAKNSSIKLETKTIVLFMQTYDPLSIRRTSMKLAHRTEAATLFEKDLDSELVLPTVVKGIELALKLAGGTIASKLYDIYPNPYKPYTITCARDKVDAYIGTKLADKEITNILTPLGFTSTITPTTVSVIVPSYRRDVEIDVDIIEEIARIYGYHTIGIKLPEREPPAVIPAAALTWEEEVKLRLRDWGCTETYTYSMLSEDLMDQFMLDKNKAYKIANPLSSEWVYMRPSLLPSILQTVAQNMHVKDDLALFELSMVYRYRPGNLPDERPMLVVEMTGEKFYEAKGLVEALFSLMGLTVPRMPKPVSSTYFDQTATLELGNYGRVGYINQHIKDAMGIKTPVTMVELDFAKMVADAKPQKQYTPIPKFPPVVEDISFVVPEGTHVGLMIEMLVKVHSLVNAVTLLDSYKQSRTFHITYLSPKKNLTTNDIEPARKALIELALSEFGATLKTG